MPRSPLYFSRAFAFTASLLVAPSSPAFFDDDGHCLTGCVGFSAFIGRGQAFGHAFSRHCLQAQSLDFSRSLRCRIRHIHTSLLRPSYIGHRLAPRSPACSRQMRKPKTLDFFAHFMIRLGSASPRAISEGASREVTSATSASVRRASRVDAAARQTAPAFRRERGRVGLHDIRRKTPAFVIQRTRSITTTPAHAAA